MENINEKHFLINWLNTNTGLNIQSIYNIAKEVDSQYTKAMQEHTKQNIEALRSELHKEIVLKLNEFGTNKDGLIGWNSTDYKKNYYVINNGFNIQIDKKSIDKTINQFLENIK